MASTIFFNGRVTNIPGSYSEVDATGLASVGLGATGIVAILGEAEGGRPQAILSAAVPSKIAKLFRAGDLLEAGYIAFDPSRDPDIPGGAQEIRFVKTNPATQSDASFANGDGEALVLESIDYGLFTTQINVEIANGTTTGKAITIVFEDTTEEYDDVGGTNIFTALYTPGTNGATTMTLDVDHTSGVEAAFTKTAGGLESDYVGTLSAGLGHDNEKLANIVAGNVAQVVSTSVADITQSVTIYGISFATGLPVSESLALNGTTPTVGAQTWTRINGIVLSAVTVGSVSVKDNVGPVTLYTITAGSLVTGGGVKVFASPIESAAAAISSVADGATTQKLILIGVNSVSAPTLEEITLSGATPVVSTTLWNSIIAVALGYVEVARTITLEGLLLNSGDTVSVVSTSAADTTQVLTVYGLTVAGAVQSETFSLNGTTPVVGTATWSRILGASLSAASVGTVSVTGSTDSVRVFTIAPADLYVGFRPVDNVAGADGTVSVVADGVTTRTMLIAGLNTSGVAQLEKFVLTGATIVVGTATWREITGIVVGHVQDARTLTVSGKSVDLALASYDTVQRVVDFLNSLDGWTGTVVVANPSTFLIADMDDTGPSNVLSVTAGFKADLFAIIDILDSESQLVDASRGTPGTGAPSNTSAPVYLSGGVEGTTTFAAWQAALDLLQDERVNTICVLTADAAVHAAVRAHCVFMAGAGRSERDAKLGAESGVSLTDAKDAAFALNTRHIQLAIEDVTRFNSDGEEETFPPYFTAVVAAGMQAGAAQVGTPLTFKFLNVLDVEGDDTTYTVREDGKELIDGGLLVIEKVPNIGFRWLRGVTTHLIDDNVAFVEASTNQAVNFAVFEFRNAMEAAVGQPGFAGTVNAALSIAVSTLGQLVSTGAITAWRSLTLELDGDVLTVDVEIAPVQPINFVKNTLHLISASFSAAA
jgi:hypothetical protein